MVENGCKLSVQGALVTIVDDDAAIRNSLKFVLELEGFSVQVFSSGVEFLREADMSDCACLVVDQNMPGMTGLELVEKLRARLIYTPAILITSHPHASLRERAADTGVSIVEKPLLGDGLLEGIRAAIARRPLSPRS